MTTLHDALRARGWRVEVETAAGSLLPPEVARRYAWLGPEVAAFLGSLRTCCSGDGASWILTASDYARPAGKGYTWNEYERMAIESARGDEAFVRDVRAFWDRHFPFMLAVHSDYDYLAVRRDDGAVVHGFAPFWEDPTAVAASVEAFLEAFEAQATGEAEYPYRLFLD